MGDMLKLLAGSSNVPLATGIAEALGLELGACEVSRFPDGELRVDIQTEVRGDDVYLLQSTGPPPHDHLVELCLLADACRRAGAGRITAVVPYLVYARQNRRTGPGEPISVRVVADLLTASGVERLVVVDPHTPDIEAIFDIPVLSTTAVPVLASALASEVGENAVIVAPDLGAVKLAEQYAAHLDQPVAIIRKTRVSGEEVEVKAVIGDVRQRTPIIVDDIISTGGTVVSAIGALLEAGCASDIFVAASHGLIVAPERLEDVPLRRLIVSDSVPPPSNLPLPSKVATIAELLAETIRRLHRERALDEILALG
ncbi:MAG: ribose-phosphate diphosphokinase [Nitriliruptorales bacterium]